MQTLIERSADVDTRKAEYEAYLQSSAWQNIRKRALKRDGHACRICNRTKQLDVHHRTYERFGHEDLNDLTTLCRPCHEKHHGKAKRSQAKAPKVGKLFQAKQQLTLVLPRLTPGLLYRPEEIAHFVPGKIKLAVLGQALPALAREGKLERVGGCYRLAGTVPLLGARLNRAEVEAGDRAGLATEERRRAERARRIQLANAPKAEGRGRGVATNALDKHSLRAEEARGSGPPGKRPGVRRKTRT